MRRADPVKARAVEAALITDGTFERVSDEVLVAAAMAVPADLLARFLRHAPAAVSRRALAALPRTVAAALEEELSLEVAPTPAQMVEARRTAYAALRKVLRERGLTSPGRRPVTVRSARAAKPGNRAKRERWSRYEDPSHRIRSPAWRSAPARSWRRGARTAAPGPSSSTPDRTGCRRPQRSRRACSTS